MIEKDLAYAAGIFDGEGSISIRFRARKKHPFYSLMLAVSMADLEPILFLHRHFAGSLHQRIDKRAERYRDLFTWTLCSNQAKDFLTQILPYLKGKSRQAKLAIHFQTNIIYRRGQQRLSQEDWKKRRLIHDLMSRLNRKGCVWSEPLEEFYKRKDRINV